MTEEKEEKSMVEVQEMNDDESKKLLLRIGYGHLGLVRDTHPYVVPVHYAYDEPHIYIYTTEGKKTEIIEANPEVCLQVENVNDENQNIKYNDWNNWDIKRSRNIFISVFYVGWNVGDKFKTFVSNENNHSASQQLERSFPIGWRKLPDMWTI